MKNYSNFFKYFKDCTFEDGSDAIFAEVKKDSVTYIKLDSEKSELSRRNFEFTETEISEIRDFHLATLKKISSASFWYGYPNALIKSWNYKNDCIKPLFYIPLKFNSYKVPEIDLMSSPRINCDAFESLGIEKEGIKKFAENIGLYNNQLEEIDFTHLGNKIIENYPDLRNIFFKGVIFYSELSIFTRGLENELKMLVDLNIQDFGKSCLNCFFGDQDVSKITNTNPRLLEVFDLNESQKRAVSSALRNRLTVVQGPPGTGKSQVVASIIINAILYKQKVLFASKNQKAIQVVEDKLSKLNKNPFYIRLGKKDGENNDLRKELLDYLNWLYRSTADPALKVRLDENNKTLIKYSSNRDELIKKIEDLRLKRNSLINILINTEKVFESEIEFSDFLNKLKKSKKLSKKHFLISRSRLAAKYIKELNAIHTSKPLEELLEIFESVNNSVKNASLDQINLFLDSQPLTLDNKKRNALNNYISVLGDLATPGLSPTVKKSLMIQMEETQREVSEFLTAWCVTNLSISGELPLDEGFFDLVVIDEASQCDIASVIPLLFRSKRAVVLGDHFQLKHITAMDNARSLELLKFHNLESRFNYVKNSFYDFSEAVETKENIIRLDEHFRSHSEIISFSKEYWYEGKLTVSTDYRNLHPKVNDGENAVSWLNVVGTLKQINSSGAYIEEEINCVVEKTIEILNDKNFKGEIGIVTPLRFQANKIRVKLNEKLSEKNRLRFLVETAVRFQGDEKDVIIFSPVVTDNLPKGVKYYYQGTENLLNVAITRARAKLYVIGNFEACLNSDISHINAFAKYVQGLSNGIKDPVPTESIYEQILYDAMKDSGLNPLKQYVVGQYRLDFAIIQDDINLNIEVDGKQFHTDLTGEKLKSDIIRNQRMQNQGWKVIRFWAYEIRDSLDYCIERIKTELIVEKSRK